MGAFCCCPCGEEFEEYAHPSSPLYRHCICLRYFLHLFSGNAATFHRLEGRSAASPTQGATSLASTELGTALPDSSLTRPMPYDTDQRFSRVQRDGLVLRREKSVNNIQEETQPLRRSSGSSCVEQLGGVKKWSGVDSEEEYKNGRSESSDKSLSTKISHGLAYILPSSEDEDVCPTCLDEYTPENPKIITRCSHHFHLGCIYEWMERSDSCPLCGKEMEFCESP
ncbi:zinc finger protein [Macleaya cordata]|uniref:RING-type E3 ubiquitin transferase n=1 Tax=Macleaya cordata TaxID=56857 RepID=A0A200R3R3_MACCD|nr:zinc finger protein [Macleaya cordata]